MTTTLAWVMLNCPDTVAPASDPPFRVMVYCTPSITNCVFPAVMVAVLPPPTTVLGWTLVLMT